MWSDCYRRMSRLRTHGGSIVDVAWHDGTLYFARRKKGERVKAWETRAVPIAPVPVDSPTVTGEVLLLESADAGGLYLLCGDRAFRTRDGGQTWEGV